MNPRLLLLLMSAAATHLPTAAFALQAFVGLGAGASRIDPNSEFVTPDARSSSSMRVGFGGRRVKVVLDWQRHGWGDDQPLPSDFQNGIQTREPNVLRTDYLLLGAQIYPTRGFYLRPALGIATDFAPEYHISDGMNADSADVENLGLMLAEGLSAGYHLKLHPRFSLAIEASALHARGRRASHAGRLSASR